MNQLKQGQRPTKQNRYNFRLRAAPLSVSYCAELAPPAYEPGLDWFKASASLKWLELLVSTDKQASPSHIKGIAKANLGNHVRVGPYAKSFGKGQPGRDFVVGAQISHSDALESFQFAITQNYGPNSSFDVSKMRIALRGRSTDISKNSQNLPRLLRLWERTFLPTDLPTHWGFRYLDGFPQRVANVDPLTGDPADEWTRAFMSNGRAVGYFLSLDTRDFPTVDGKRVAGSLWSEESWRVSLEATFHEDGVAQLLDDTSLDGLIRNGIKPKRFFRFAEQPKRKRVVGQPAWAAALENIEADPELLKSSKFGLLSHKELDYKAQVALSSLNRMYGFGKQSH